MKLRKILSVILCLALLCGLMPTAFAAQTQTIEVNPINIMVGGKEFLPTDANGKDVPVFVYNGTTYAPLRALAEAYGLTVGYNSSKKLATVDGTPSGDFVGTMGTAQALTERTTLTVSSINIEVNSASVIACGCIVHAEVNSAHIQEQKCHQPAHSSGRF